jgi:hypothetical protein
MNWNARISNFCGSHTFLVSWGGVRPGPPGTAATNLPIVPDPDDGWWMCSSRWNENWQRKPAPLPLCPSQISHDLTWARTRVATVGSRQLTLWAMARPSCALLYVTFYSCSRHLRFFSFLIISNTGGPVLLLLFLKPRIETNFFSKQSFTRCTLCKNFHASSPFLEWPVQCLP